MFRNFIISNKCHRYILRLPNAGCMVLGSARFYSTYWLILWPEVHSLYRYIKWIIFTILRGIVGNGTACQRILISVYYFRVFGFYIHLICCILFSALVRSSQYHKLADAKQYSGQFNRPQDSSIQQQCVCCLE